MINSMLWQQMSGVLNLAIPLVLLYNVFPNFVLSYLGIACCSLAIGLYLGFITYVKSNNQVNSWKFIPSKEHAQSLYAIIAQCGFKPEEVALRYAYADDGIAITLFNTIVIDPMLWKDIEDPEFFKTRDIIEKFVLPGVPENKKTLHANINKMLARTTQNFILKHELGHIFYNYSMKRIWLTGIIGTLATGAALLTVHASIAWLGGLGSFLLGIFIGTVVDLFLSYASNVFFKAREEKKADLFACTFSSKQEIEDAADFFEQYEQYAQEYRNTIGGIITLLPTVILSGYINGAARACYLRAIAASK